MQTLFILSVCSCNERDYVSAKSVVKELISTNLVSCATFWLSFYQCSRPPMSFNSLRQCIVDKMHSEVAHIRHTPKHSLSTIWNSLFSFLQAYITVMSSFSILFVTSMAALLCVSAQMDFHRLHPVWSAASFDGYDEMETAAVNQAELLAPFNNAYDGYYGVNNGFDYDSYEAAGATYGGQVEYAAPTQTTKQPLTESLPEQTLAPIYAKPIVRNTYIDQDIMQPKVISQPILKQRVVEQPIYRTRVINQPVIRRIITQPIIRPHIITKTTIKPHIVEQTTVKPRYIDQNIVRQQYVTKPIQNQPIMAAPTTTKKGATGYASGYGDAEMYAQSVSYQN